MMLRSNRLISNILRSVKLKTLACVSLSVVTLSGLFVSANSFAEADPDLQRVTSEQHEIEKEEKIIELKKQTKKLMREKKFGKASQNYQQLSLDEPDNMKHQVNLVRNLMVLNRKSKARQSIKKMLASEPENSGVLMVAAELAMLEGKSELALDYYSQATQADPKEKSAWIGKANVLYQMQKVELADQAMTEFEKLDQMDSLAQRDNKD